MMMLAETDKAKYIPSHDLAQWFLKAIDTVYGWFGVTPTDPAREVIYVIVVTLAALLFGWLVRVCIVGFSKRVMRNSKSELCRTIYQEHVMTKCSHVITPLIILGLLPYAFESGARLMEVMQRIVVVWLIVVVAIAINAVLVLAWTRYNNLQNSRNLPLRGILNSAQGVVWIVAVIVIVSVVIDKSPVVLLTGLGAFAAALMLIFKDSILGLVAGIQLSQNDMVRVGDWIEVPGTPVNGNVMDITLTTVKVRNFDNTVATLPPYTLVSQSFKNWRGMQEMQSRRIKFTLTFDFNSVRPLAAGEADALGTKYPVLGAFLKEASPVDTSTGRLWLDPDNRINGALETNLGLFRAYVCAYIMANEQFDHKGDLLVYTLDTTPQGVPLQIYCFSVDWHWTPFQAVQSALTEHLVAVAPDFGLNPYNALNDATLRHAAADAGK